MKIFAANFDKGGMGHSDSSSKAPRIIIEQMKNIFSDSRLESVNEKEIEVNDLDIGASHEKIYSTLQGESNFLLIGGDHSITFPAVKAWKNNNDGYLVILDAHADAVSEILPPTHEDFVQTLVEQNIISPEKIIIVGLRNVFKDEKDFLQSKNIKYFTAQEFEARSINKIVEDIKNIVKEEKIYLSVDIDVVDPVEAIGVGYLDNGGMSSRELIYLISRLRPNIDSADVVEVVPDKDINNITSKLAAQVIVELMDRK